MYSRENPMWPGKHACLGPASGIVHHGVFIGNVPSRPMLVLLCLSNNSMHYEY